MRKRTLNSRNVGRNTSYHNQNIGTIFTHHFDHNFDSTHQSKPRLSTTFIFIFSAARISWKEDSQRYSDDSTVQRFRVRHGLSWVNGPFWPVRAGCYSQAALSLPHSKPLYITTAGTTRSDMRFCYKFSHEFHWPIGHTTAAVQPGRGENAEGTSKMKYTEPTCQT